MGGTDPLARLIAAASVAFLLLGCASPRPSDSTPPPDPPVATAEPTPTEVPTPVPSMPSWFGEALVVVGSTGEFSDPAQRTVELPATLVIWRDGVVSMIAAIWSEPQTYSSLEINDAELAALESMLRDGHLVDYVHEPGEGDSTACADCNDVVIQADVDGRFVEVILPLIGYQMSYPPGVDALADYMAELWRRGERSAVPWTGTMPTVLAAPLEIGG